MGHRGCPTVSPLKAPTLSPNSEFSDTDSHQLAPLPGPYGCNRRGVPLGSVLGTRALTLTGGLIGFDRLVPCHSSGRVFQLRPCVTLSTRVCVRVCVRV